MVNKLVVWWRTFLKDPEIQDGGSKMVPFAEIMAEFTLTDLKGNIFDKFAALINTLGFTFWS